VGTEDAAETSGAAAEEFASRCRHPAHGEHRCPGAEGHRSCGADHARLRHSGRLHSTEAGGNRGRVPMRRRALQVGAEGGAPAETVINASAGRPALTWRVRHWASSTTRRCWPSPAPPKVVACWLRSSAS